MRSRGLSGAVFAPWFWTRGRTESSRFRILEEMKRGRQVGHRGRRRIVVVERLTVQSTQMGVVDCIAVGVELVMVGGVGVEPGMDLVGCV